MKFKVLVLAVLLFALPQFALGANTLLDGVTTTGAGNVITTTRDNLGAFSNYVVTVVYETAAPTAATVKLQGSVDGTNFIDMGSTSDVSATTVGFGIANMPFTYIRGNLTAYTAGSCDGVTVEVERGM